jgi:hypothetical protein
MATEVCCRTMPLRRRAVPPSPPLCRHATPARHRAALLPRHRVAVPPCSPAAAPTCHREAAPPCPRPAPTEWIIFLSRFLLSALRSIPGTAGLTFSAPRSFSRSHTWVEINGMSKLDAEPRCSTGFVLIKCNSLWCSYVIYLLNKQSNNYVSGRLLSRYDLVN